MKNAEKLMLIQFTLLVGLIVSLRTGFSLPQNIAYELVGAVLGTLIATSGIYGMKKKT